MHVVIVESPAKAKTINKYLGKDFEVLASYGHVRDLPSKDGSVNPEADFDMAWSVDDRGEKRLRDIARAVKQADQLYLATDPDREGEAISWHIVEELQRRKALKKETPVKRVVFNEITKSAVIEAFKHPRELNRELIDAYLARRALDYLVGFTLSPVLWRKLPGSRSAGRVQSVALRLICERESEIEIFRPQEYWSLAAELEAVGQGRFKARLAQLEGEKIERLSLGNEGIARHAEEVVRTAGTYRVASVERKQVRRHPQPPFTTSTLQQEASRKLGLGASRTMRLAQQLYEGHEINGETVGLITYMRTDGVAMSNEAISLARGLIGEQYGDSYLPDAPRHYKSKAKNAQEAHEPVRPTDFRRTPEKVRRFVPQDEARLYELIYLRALASQMESARFEQVSVDITVGDGRTRLRATGQIPLFDGFLTLYQEGRDEDGEDENQTRLPKLEEGQDLHLRDVLTEQHFTQPPPRYSEASLVKKLEELGIGRPSTYASILQVLQDRDYVRLEKKRFIPEDRGRMVTAFLQAFFQRYVEYDFTAQLENQLDDISGGREDWKEVLRRFWSAFSTATEETKGLRIAEVIDALDRDLGPHFFPLDPENPDKDPRLCRSCNEGRLGLRIGKTGGFIGCSNYPDCRYTRPLGQADGEGGDLAAEPRKLGLDPECGLEVTLRKGPYGLYVQLGEAANKGEKPKRASLPKTLPPDQVDLERALALLSLPRTLGQHEGEEVTASIGRFGPYVRKGKTYKSIPADEDVLAIGLNRAVDLLAQKVERGGGALKTLGTHPDGGEVTVHSGRYGPYVKHGKINATLPKDSDPQAVTLEEALPLIAAKAAKAPAGKRKTTTAKKAPAKKTASSKAAPSKAGSSKTASSKAASSKTGSSKTGSSKAAAKKTASTAK